MTKAVYGSVRVNGESVASGMPSSPIPLMAGRNKVTVTAVTYGDPEEDAKDYRIDVVRPMTAVFGTPQLDGEVDDAGGCAACRREHWKRCHSG